MNNRIELVYFQGCPHVDAARAAVREALSAMGMSLRWSEWDRDDESTPAALRKYGSPTVLVNGRDVVPTESDGNCCRVYPGSDGLRSAPAVEKICAALAAINSKTDCGQT